MPDAGVGEVNFPEWTESLRRIAVALENLDSARADLARIDDKLERLVAVVANQRE